MILKEYDLSVRLPQERAIDTGITLVQNDKDVYKLNIRIFDGVNEIDYSEVDSATITFLKSDKNVVQGDMTIEADQLSYTLGTNEIAAPGKLLASIQLLGANERLTTARFLFRVEKDLITEDAVKSTSEFAILQRLKEELEAIDVVDLTNQFNAHKAENATQGDAPHGMVYEEGTWTPSYATTGSPFDTLIYAEQTGRYVRIGNVVTVSGTIRTANAIKGSASGDLIITGLPFVSSRAGGVTVGHIVRFGSNFNINGAFILNANIYIAKNTPDDARTLVLAQDLRDGVNNYYNYFIFSATYII